MGLQAHKRYHKVPNSSATSFKEFPKLLCSAVHMSQQATVA